MNFQIVNYSPECSSEIADLFYQSVHAIDPDIYTQQQKNAWAPTPIDYEYWSNRLEGKQPFVAMRDDRVVGFIELDPDGHIDCMYTHPDSQRLGVGSALFDHVLLEANAREIDRLYVEASIFAKPFFECRAFQVVRKNEVIRNGIVLENFTMERFLR